MDSREMYDRDRRERLANLAPQRDQQPSSEADVWNGAPQDRDAKRVKQVQRDQYADFHRRRFGRQITEAEYPENLRNEGGDVA